MVEKPSKALKMPKYGKRSIHNLSTAHSALVILFSEVIKYFDCSIIEGSRSVERQKELFDKGFSKIDGKTKKSKHNFMPSLAVDVVPYPINWSDKKRMYYFAGFVKGIAKLLLKEGKIKHEIRWGGDWDGDTKINDQTFIDLPHFELKKIVNN